LLNDICHSIAIAVRWNLTDVELQGPSPRRTTSPVSLPCSYSLPAIGSASHGQD
jgi:hypothetical protein